MKLFQVFGVCIAVAAAVVLDSDKNQVPPFSCAEDHLLLYTLGKTGSSTFQSSLKQLCAMDNFDFLDHPGQNYSRAVKVQQSHDAAEDFLAKLPSTGRVWIVTLVRHPFERIVSSFFQTHWCLYQMHDGATESVERAMRGFHDKLKRPLDSFRYYDAWKNVTGVDLLQHRFNHAKKRMFINGQYNGRTLNVLLLRKEDIAEWESILAPFFPNFELIPDNQADKKMYAELYSGFKADFRFTQTEVNSILENSAELQFYKPWEQERKLRQLKPYASGSTPFIGLLGSRRAVMGDKAHSLCDGMGARKTERAAARLQR